MIMPEGPFGFRRLTDLGPFVSRTPEEVVTETIDELNSITNSGMLDVGFDHLILSRGISSTLTLPDGTTIILGEGGGFGQYIGPSTTGEDTDAMFIVLDSAMGILSEDEEDFWDRMLEYWTAHEYSHRIQEDYAGSERHMIEILESEGLFDESKLRRIESVSAIEGTVPNSKDEFIESLEQTDTNAPSADVEALANMVGVQYSGLDIDTVEDAKSVYQEKSNRIGQLFMTGEVSDKWLWNVIHHRDGLYDLRRADYEAG